MALAQKVGCHRNIVRLLGAGMDGVSFTMERAAGDLHQAIRRWRRNLPIAYVRQWGHDVLAAVAHIHEMGVVHQAPPPAAAIQVLGTGSPPR